MENSHITLVGIVVKQPTYPVMHIFRKRGDARIPASTLTLQAEMTHLLLLSTLE